MNVVLYQPQIPQNTGNIVRSCSVMGCGLVLIPPLGFSLNDRWLKRAGLDYWEGVNVTVGESLEKIVQEAPSTFYFFSSKGQSSIDAVSYDENSLLIFGSETSGLPDWVFQKFPEKCVQIPMVPGSRCLNLATSVGIGLYEAIRQIKPKR